VGDGEETVAEQCNVATTRKTNINNLSKPIFIIKNYTKKAKSNGITRISKKSYEKLHVIAPI
jgi:hypothetical protein